MTHDPRYSATPARETIQVVQAPSNSNQHLLLGMLVLQLIFLAGLFYVVASRPDQTSQQAALENNQQTIRQQAQAELLERVVAGQAGNGELATEFTRLKEQEFLLRSSLDGQLARLEKESTLRQRAESEFQKSNELGQRLQVDLQETRTELAYAKKQIDATDSSSEMNPNQSTSFGDWIFWLTGSLGLLVVGGGLGYGYHAKQNPSVRQQVATGDDPESFELAESSAADIEYHEQPATSH